MDSGFAVVRIRVLLLLLISTPITAYSESIMVGDIEIGPEDFSAKLDPEQRIIECVAGHGKHLGGDIDFGPDVHFGTPALRGMQETYLRESLIAYKTGTRIHEEMSIVSSMLDEETIDFIAGYLSAQPPPPLRTAGDITDQT